MDAVRVNEEAEPKTNEPPPVEAVAEEVEVKATPEVVVEEAEIPSEP